MSLIEENKRLKADLDRLSNTEQPPVQEPVWNRKAGVLGCKEVMSDKCYQAQSAAMQANYEPQPSSDVVVSRELLELLIRCRKVIAHEVESDWPSLDELIERIDALLANQEVVKYGPTLMDWDDEQEPVEPLMTVAHPDSAKAEQTPVQEPVALTEAAFGCFVQPVPSHCDRITWRGNYYHLPIAAPQPVSDDARDALVEAISEVVGCFDAAEIEGWSAAVQSGDFDSIRDLWHRRISFAYYAANEALAAYRAAQEKK